MSSGDLWYQIEYIEPHCTMYTMKKATFTSHPPSPVLLLILLLLLFVLLFLLLPFLPLLLLLPPRPSSRLKSHIPRTICSAALTWTGTLKTKNRNQRDSILFANPKFLSPMHSKAFLSIASAFDPIGSLSTICPLTSIGNFLENVLRKVVQAQSYFFVFNSQSKCCRTICSVASRVKTRSWPREGRMR